jgi:hypothetical protein
VEVFLLIKKIKLADMLQVEFKKRTDQGEYIIVNGIADQNSSGSQKEKGVLLTDESVFDILMSESFEEIEKHLEQIAIHKNVIWWDTSIEIVIDLKKTNLLNYINKAVPATHTSIMVYFGLESEDWTKAWSIKSFVKEFENVINFYRDQNFPLGETNIDPEYSDILHLEYIVEDEKLNGKEEVEKALNIINQIITITNQNLISLLNEDSLTTFFEFPNEIKTACKQYLVYFAQFLKDMGIEAETEIHEKVQKTLFKVIPKEKTATLENIRNALEVYLNVPGLSDFEYSITNNSDMAAMQWKANVMHLKSQLMLANSALQMKDATIETLQLSNYQYQQILNDKEIKKESDKEEDIIKNILSVNLVSKGSFH